MRKILVGFERARAECKESKIYHQQRKVAAALRLCKLGQIDTVHNSPKVPRERDMLPVNRRSVSDPNGPEKFFMT